MDYDSLLANVRKAARYLGCEKNAAAKPWDSAEVRACLIFPDLYEIGMSHLGLQILYHILNDLDWALADRAYCPDLDLERLLRAKEWPLWGLEQKRPLGRFDLLGITLPYELSYTNILTILSLSGIPFLSRQRDEGEWPLIIGGGSGAFNPEPVAEIFDAILLGDGEEAVIELARTVRRWKREGGRRDELLKELAGMEGVYVPRFYHPRYDAKGAMVGIERDPDAPARVMRRILPDLDSAPFPRRPLLPFIQTVHDRLGIEIARGCTRSCRFCQAGVIYRPVRERSPETVEQLARRGLKATGWSELGMLSLSTGDYSRLHPLIQRLMELCQPLKVAISLPSLRVGTLTPEIMKEIVKVRKTGFTLAPEAGSQRLREVINKGITEEDLLETAKEAYRAGWRNIKLYFMIGLPTETMEDVEAIRELALKVSAQHPRRRGGQVTISVGTFVPKPHTPFQWERQIGEEEARERIALLRQGLPKRIRIKWHDPALSFMEGVFSRGDRRLLPVIIRAWELGARLDAWSDHFRPELFQQAAEEQGIELSWYLRERGEEELLPWDHLDTGVKREFLLKERRRARERSYTPDCRNGRCQGCGVCDFKRVKPVIFRGSEAESAPSKAASAGPVDKPAERWMVAFRFAKLNQARFISHLDTMRAFHRAAARAELPVAFSQGFHPMPRFSFGDALPVGLESVCEPAALELTRFMRPHEVAQALNRELPHGLGIILAEMGPMPQTAPDGRRHVAFIPHLQPRDLQEMDLSKAPPLLLTMGRRGTRARVEPHHALEALEPLSPDELLPLLQGWEPLDREGVLMGFTVKRCTAVLEDGSSRTVMVRPLDLIAHLFPMDEEQRALVRIVRVG